MLRAVRANHPVVEESWQRPAYILKGDRALVDVPGLGFVEGRALLNYEFKDPHTALRRTAEIIVVDDAGNFIYMRNRPPKYPTKRDILAFWNETENTLRQNGKSSGREVLEFKAVALGKIKFDSPTLQARIGSFALTASEMEHHGYDDHEIWALQIYVDLKECGPFPREQKSEEVLVFGRGGDGSYYGADPPRFQPRRYYFKTAEAPSDIVSGDITVYEEWIGEAPPGVRRRGHPMAPQFGPETSEEIRYKDKDGNEVIWRAKDQPK
jgi:hypothetical protein